MWFAIMKGNPLKPFYTYLNILVQDNYLQLSKEFLGRVL